MTTKQWLKIKSSIIDTNNYLNGIFPSFNKKLLFGFRIVDNFPNHFSFYPANHKNKENIEAYLWKLDKIFEVALLNPDTSIKNNITSSISHVHSNLNSVTKTIHYTVDIMPIEAKKFAIRCGINQAIQIPDASHIIVITDAIYSVR